MPSGEIIALDTKQTDGVVCSCYTELNACEHVDLEQLRRQMISMTRIIERIIAKR